MTKLVRTFSSVSSAMAGALALSLAASPGWAHSQTAAASCFAGKVGAYDWAELSSNFQESMWNSRAGVNIVSASTRLVLSVVDSSNNSVCADVSDKRTRCHFTQSSGEDFTIKVDNSGHGVASYYKMCAY